MSHGYLFFGESSGARTVFGRRILNFLETGDWDNLAGSPLIDSLFLSGTDGTLGIDGVREAIRFVWQTPFRSPYRAVFLDGDVMTPEAQNALLKTAEEPPAHGVILIGARDAQTLVAPLASRLEKFYVSPASSFSSPSEGGRVWVGEALARKFIIGDAKSRKDIIKAVVADERAEATAEFIEALLVECRRDSLKNFRLMGGILNRWTKICDFNTNKKLQLETLIAL